MKTYASLPSLFSESKLFPSHHELQQTRNQLRTRLSSQSIKNQSEQKRSTRALIQFTDKAEGFTSFRSLNSTKMQDILGSLKNMKSSASNIGRTIKAQILFNKNEYAKITDYCSTRRKSQKEEMLIRLSKLQPLPMKKEVKRVDKNKKKVKTTVGIKLAMNYGIYQKNRLCWKPFIDFDAMGVAVGRKTYFIGGRQSRPLTYYDRTQDKWVQEQPIQGLKPFGESQGTVLSEQQIIFFGGSRFFLVGQSQPTNTITHVNVLNHSASVQLFDEAKVASRCFHAQCKFGDFLVISGGIDRKYKLLNTFNAYHLNKKYWLQLTITKMPQRLQSGFAKHKMMPILLPRKKYNFYDDSEAIITTNRQISQQGIYLFGGEDSNVELSDKLYIMKIGTPSLQIYEPVIKGKYPEPRKNFDWLRLREYLFIHGGRNDEMRPWTLNSIFALNLITMNWIKISGEKPTYRHSHVLNGNDNEIVILGGKNMDGLCKQVYPISFEQLIEYV